MRREGHRGSTVSFYLTSKGDTSALQTAISTKLSPPIDSSRIIVGQTQDDSDSEWHVVVVIKSDGTTGSAAADADRISTALGNAGSKLRTDPAFKNFDADKGVKTGTVTDDCEADPTKCSGASALSVSVVALFATILALFF
jgi:hypothetical protein